MASGGARGTSGPAPDPNALRRDRPGDAAGWTTLPADGRKGPAPEWPLTGAPAHLLVPPMLPEDEEDKQRVLDRAEADASAAFARELELWAREWRRPQAVQWEANGQEVEVALYVRALAAAESPTAKVTLRTLVKQMQEALGLSLPGLARNRWRIAEAEDRDAAPRRRSGRSARDRFTVVEGGGGS